MDTIYPSSISQIDRMLSILKKSQLKGLGWNITKCDRGIIIKEFNVNVMIDLDFIFTSPKMTKENSNKLQGDDYAHNDINGDIIIIIHDSKIPDKYVKDILLASLHMQNWHYPLSAMLHSHHILEEQIHDAFDYQIYISKKLFENDVPEGTNTVLYR